MIKWIRPSGSTIETRDTPEIAEYAKLNGWKAADKPKSKKVAKNDNSKSDDRGGS